MAGQIARNKKRTAKKIHKSIGQLLSYIKRNLKSMVLKIEKKFAVSFNASKGVTYYKENKFLEIYRSIIEKTRLNYKKNMKVLGGI